MRLYVSMRLESDDASPEHLLSEATKVVRVATTPEGAVRQLLEMADRTELPHPELGADPHGVAAHLTTLREVYDVSEHNLDIGTATPAGDAVPASLTDEEFAEMQKMMGEGHLSGRSRSLIKRFLDAPLPHQMRTPEEIDAYWSGIMASAGFGTEPKQKG